MPFVSRTFERDDGLVSMWLFQPRLDPSPYDVDPADPPWRSDYRLDYPDGSSTSGYAIGIDGMQALLLAIASGTHRMHYVGNATPEKRPPARWLGSDDLGLRINHFDQGGEAIRLGDRGTSDGG